MFIELNTVCYKNYVVKVKNNIKINPKKFYNFENTKKKSEVYPSAMTYSGTSDDKDYLLHFLKQHTLLKFLMNLRSLLTKL